MKKPSALLATLFLSTLSLAAQAATDWSMQDYGLYPGDFNGDGKTDLLYVAKDATKPSGITLSDGNGPNVPYQSWPSNYLGIPWDNNTYRPVVADFNGDGRADVFMQRNSPGNHFLLLANNEGKLVAANQTIPNSYLGVVWSADQHHIVAGDFNGDGKADLFLQAATSTTPIVNAIFYADGNGTFTSGPTQSWNDGYLGFKWSATNALVHVGDFNGDGRQDLLLQARPRFVSIRANATTPTPTNVSVPVPTYPPNLNGVLLSQGGASPFIQAGVQAFSRNAFGGDFSPLISTIVVGDFNGDGRADVLLQSRSASRTSFLATGNASGAAFATATALANNVTISADNFRVIAGNFNGTGGAGIYLQSNGPTGTNFYTNVITGGSISLTAHDPTMSLGVVPGNTTGVIPASFAVGNDGSANFSVPLDVPPGIAGLQPELALAYSNRRGNGWVGIGWDISGLSQITRCARTAAQDGAPGNVSLTTGASGDRFCLDGNRLRLTSGTYGAANSTYQTEIETFSRVTASGSAGNGPASFLVESKNGLKYEYGVTNDSRIESLGTSTPRVWALNKVFDRSGNVMTVSYGEDTVNGSFRPDEILYTANAAAGVNPAYRMKFFWETRPNSDPIRGYFAGNPVREVVRLNRIETQFNDPAAGGFRVVNRYQLSYNSSPTTSRSRLSAVQQCDGSGNCLLPWQISWQDGVKGWSATEMISASDSSADMTASYPIDFDGDGRDDLVYPQAGTWWFMRANGSPSGFGSPTNTGVDAQNSSFAKPIDYFAEGRTGLLINPVNANTLQILRWNGTTLVQVNTPLISPLRQSWAADIDGDGRTDVLHGAVTNNTGFLFLSRNSGSTTTVNFDPAVQVYSTPLGSSDFFHPFNGQSTVPTNLIDLNGDGRAEFFYGTRDQGNVPYWHVLLWNGSGYVSVTPGGAVAGNALTADINGDGLEDIVADGNKIYYGTGAASGLAAPISFSAPSLGFNLLGFTADYDGDGRTDIAFRDTLANAWFVARSTSNGFEPAVSIPLGNSITVTNTVRTLDVDGDGQRDIGFKNTQFRVLKHNGAVPDLIRSLVDGFGNSNTLTYAPLTDSSVYTRGTGAVYPMMDTQMPLYVVKQSSQTDGTGGTFNIFATYTAARADISGRGFLAFASRRLQDSRTGIYSYDFFRQDFPFAGQISQHDDRQSDNATLIERTTSSFTSTVLDSTANNQRYLVTQSQAVAKRYEVGGTKNGVQIAEETTNFTTYDSFGNPTDLTSSITDKDSASPFFNQTWTTRAVNTITNYPSTWCLGKPTQVAITSTLPDTTAQTRTVAYTIDSTACRTTQEVVEPNSNNLKVTKSFTYNTTPASCGNIESVSVIGKNFDGTDMQPRTTSFDYGTRCIAPEKVTNALGQVTTLGYRYDLGLQTSIKDPNQLTTTTTYDNFGRKLRVQRPDGTATEQTFATCTAPSYCGVPDLRFQAQTVERDASNAAISTSITFFDGLGRPRLAQAQRSTGALSYVTSTYDSLGRQLTTSQPYSTTFNGLTRNTYDLLGRTTKTELVRADGSVDRSNTIAYAGGTVSVTDAKLKTAQRVLDPLGLVRRATDAAGSTTQYTYEHFRNLKTLVDSAGNTTSATFNIRGFNTGLSTPDTGNSTFRYNSLGELTSQTDAKNQTASVVYDRLGRIVSRVEPEGTSTFTFDTAANGIGEIASVSSPGGYAEAHTYDTLGRKQRITWTLDTAYSVDYSYNNQGLLDTVTYPTSTNSYRLKLQYVYAFGALTQVKDFNAPGTVFWAQNASDDADRPIDETLGNGVRLISGYNPLTGELNARQSGNGGSTSNLQSLAYQWDKTGNLTQRQDTRQNLTEAFSYDNLDRLTGSTLNGTSNLSVAYSAIGNITSKSDVGAYNYNTAQTGCSYYAHTQPHAVRRAGTSVYCYDQNGNMTRRAGSSITWTSYNLPSQIASGSNSSQFSYGADHQRWRQVATYSGTTETTIYVAGIMDKVTRSGVTEYRHYIAGGSDASAIYTRRSNGSSDTFYTTTDHLGSTDLITNNTGAVRLRESFTAFGARRGSNWSGAPSTADLNQITATTRDGYTGHEHLDNVGLIHMNGRVYDPRLARFISADPFVQSPQDSQSLNRYSYVFNSPLSFTDPSGFAGANGITIGFNVPTFGSLGFGLRTTTNPDSFRGSSPFLNPDFFSSPFFNSPGRPEVIRVPRMMPAAPPATMTGMTTPRPGAPNPAAAARDGGFFSAGVRRFISGAADVLPGVSTVKGVVELVTGTDYITGEMISRTVAASGLVLSAIPAGKFIAKGGAVLIGKVFRKADDVADEAAKTVARTSCCFVAGTLVATEEGLRPIEEIEVGDRVLSRDDVTGETDFKEVTELIRRHEREIWELVFEVSDGEGQVERAVFETTDDHPWMLDAGVWARTDELQAGMRVLRAEGSAATIVSVQKTDRVAPTFNLEVDEFHTYFVGKAGVWVHNCEITSVDPRKIRFSQDSIKGAFSDGRSVQDLVDGLKSGRISPDDVPPIRVVERDGQLISIDNRRLAAFKEAGVPIRTRPATAEEITQAEQQGKFSAGRRGADTIRVRGKP